MWTRSLVCRAESIMIARGPITDYCGTVLLEGSLPRPTVRTLRRPTSLTAIDFVELLIQPRTVHNRRATTATGHGRARYARRTLASAIESSPVAAGREARRRLMPSRPREFHPEPLTDSGREPLDSSGSCHRMKAAAFHCLSGSSRCQLA